MRLPKNCISLIEKARDSATQAISTYNDPRSIFRTGNFSVLMIIAWTALLHAYFEKNKTKYFYKKNQYRYQIIDGEKKAWDLQKCVSEIFDENDPIRKNIELFIRLRNKIEHRNLPGLDPELVGESQALVLNFEELLKERLSWGDIPNQSGQEFMAMWKRAYEERDWQPPGSYSSAQSGQRLQQTIEKYSATNHEHIAFVTHAGIITDFLLITFGVSFLNSIKSDFSQKNDKSIHEASVTVIRYDSTQGNYTLDALGTTAHLPNELLIPK